MIAYRTRRCHLRKPRIWLWALAVALPAHVGLAWALNLQRHGELVACPITSPLQVSLVKAETLQQAAVKQQVRQFSQALNTPKARPQLMVKNNPTSQPTQPTRPTLSQAAPAIAATEPAAGPRNGSQPAGRRQLGVVPVAQIGFMGSPPSPPYPAASRARGEEGTALLLAKLSGRGAPEAVKLESSSGYTRLDTAALKAAQGWQFNAPPQPVWVRLPVHFALNE